MTRSSEFESAEQSNKERATELYRILHHILENPDPGAVEHRHTEIGDYFLFSAHVLEGKPGIKSTCSIFYIVTDFIECDIEGDAENHRVQLPDDVVINVIYNGEPYLQISPEGANMIRKRDKIVLREANDADLRHAKTMAKVSVISPAFPFPSRAGIEAVYRPKTI